MAGFAPAQDQPEPGERDQQEPTFEAPLILSRDSVFSESRGKPLEFGLFGKIAGVYDSALTPVFHPDQTTPSAPQADSGMEATFGAGMWWRTRRSKLTAEYRGDYRQYTTGGLFDGLDQFFQIVYSRSLDRHLVLDVKSTAGTTTLANGAFAYLPLSNLDRFGLPLNELFDERTDYSESRVDLTWQKSARLSFGVGGDGHIVRRESRLLAGLNGYSVRASVAYRLTARQTISVAYNRTYFDFDRAYGDSRLQIPTVGYSAEPVKYWDFGLQAGAARVEMVGLKLIAVDPAIVALTGQAFATVTFARTSYLPVGEARLVRKFRTSSMAVDYLMGVTPGNGYYLTSRENSATLNYSYLGGRRWEGRGIAGFNELSAVGQSLGKYTNVQAGVEIFYNLTDAAHLDVRYDYRHYTTEDAILQKDSNRVSVGFAYSLGEPFRTAR
jgi:hypothetical protein